MHNGTFSQNSTKAIMYIQHFDPMSSYPGLPFYITVDNCNYQLIIRGIKSPHEFIYKVSNYSFTIWYIVEAGNILGFFSHRREMLIYDNRYKRCEDRRRGKAEA